MTKDGAFKNKRVLIMGLGLHGGGVGAARFFAKAGARVTVTDLRSRRDLAPSVRALKGLPIRYVLGRHRVSDFVRAGLVIQNPGAPDSSPYLAAARRAGVAVDTDVGVFSDFCPAPIIAVTGTKGKSTTATLIAECLRKKFRDVVLAGNIRTSVLSVLHRIKPTTKVVLELSSWQLEGLARKKFSPHIALITNIFPEHLNRYPSFAAYVHAKGLITKFQGAGDHLFISAPSRIPRGKVRRFIRRKDALVQKMVAGTAAHVHRWSESDALPARLRVLGEHNRANMRAAQAVARHFGVPKPMIWRVFRSFRGLAGRLEVVRRLNGVTYINDTTATMPEAAIAAIRALKQPPVVIAGGTDKNLDYSVLACVLARETKAFVLLSGSATKKLKQFLGSSVSEAHSMAQALALARRQARRGDTVLLSPGAASFESFRNEFDRGAQFVDAVKKLRNENLLRNRHPERNPA